MAPHNINRYEIKSEIGRGGMAIVYKAHDPRFKRDVAIKVLPREFLYDTKFRARFEREAQAIASLEHLAIVPVYDFGEEGGQPYLVMRYMLGGSLADRIKSGTLSFQEAGRIITHLAPALDEAHAKGIIHRDLKPGNILFDQHGNPYLSDFGIVKIAEATATLTGTGLIGTPAYMSPEQVVGDRDIDSRSDIYALGVILYQMLTGKLPYEADTPIRLAFKHVNEPVPNIRDLKPDLPAVCDEVIVRAMAKDAEDRYQTAGELAEALSTPTMEKATLVEPALQVDESPPIDTKVLPRDMEVGVGTVMDEVVPPTLTIPRRRVPVWVWIIGGLAIISTIIGVLNIGPREGESTVASSASSATQTKASIGIVTAKPIMTLTSTYTLIPTPTSTPTVTLIPTPTLAISTMVSPADGMVMVYVDSGVFLMGSADDDPEIYYTEKPQHEVYLDSFWIDQVEITNDMFAVFLNEMSNQIEGGAYWLDTNSEDVRVESVGGEWSSIIGYGNHPVVEVSWYGAKAYCDWTGRRLPMEAEWEKAARGTDGCRYPWGDETPTCERANYGGCVGDTTKGGTYPHGMSPFGAYDMAGNVWEWVEDRYYRMYFQSPVSNPTGPSSGDIRIRRGGSWDFYHRAVRVVVRRGFDSITSRNNLGFRCANDASP